MSESKPEAIIEGNALLEVIRDCAFPQHVELASGAVVSVYGLRKRELFAALAMQGALQGLGALAARLDPDQAVDVHAIAADAVKAADALIAALERKP